MAELFIVPELAKDFTPAFDSEEMIKILREQSRARARSEEEVRRKRVF